MALYLIIIVRVFWRCIYWLLITKCPKKNGNLSWLVMLWFKTEGIKYIQPIIKLILLCSFQRKPYCTKTLNQSFEYLKLNNIQYRGTSIKWSLICNYKMCLANKTQLFNWSFQNSSSLCVQNRDIFSVLIFYCMVAKNIYRFLVISTNKKET